MPKQLNVVAAVLVATGLTLGGQQPPPERPTAPPAQGLAPAAQATNLGSDPSRNPLRLALKTGHTSNYDEASVAPHALLDPLVLANGKPVRDRQIWIKQRRHDSQDVRDRDPWPSAAEGRPVVPVCLLTKG